MKSREELRNDYEEALFAMIMDEIMDLEGEALIAERERLALSEEFEISDELNKRCISAINDAFTAKKKETRRLKTRKVLRTVLVAAVVMSIMFTTVYASVPAVRRVADEMVMAFSNVCARLVFGDAVVHVDGGRYVFSAIPKEFCVVEEGEGEGTKWCTYSNEQSVIWIEIDFDCEFNEQCVDLEDADEVKRVDFGPYMGVFVVKGERVHVAIHDEVRGNMIQVICYNLDPVVVEEIIESVDYIG